MVLLLAGCTTPLQYVDTSVDGPKLNASDPHPVQMRDVEFIILSKKNIEQYIADIESGDLVLFALDTEDYKDLSINTLSLLNYIKSQQGIILAYREFYEQ